MLSLPYAEKEELKRYNLHTLISLRQVRIMWDFLRAAAEFWDSELHLFRFGEKELCPLPEEFGAMLGFKFTSTPVIPTSSRNTAPRYTSLLGLEKDDLERILEGERVNFLPLISLLKRSDHVERRTRALVLCLLGGFCFYHGGTNSGPASLINISESLRDDQNLAPMIVAETILCLDRLCEEPKGEFSGSPLLLQVIVFQIGADFTPITQIATYKSAWVFFPGNPRGPTLL